VPYAANAAVASATQITLPDIVKGIQVLKKETRTLKSGAATRESIQELIEILYMKDIWWTKLRDRMTVIANSGRGMGGDSLTIGGVDKEGKDATNDLTYMCLDALAHTRWGTPWLAVRWHENTPRELKIKTANVIRIGTG